MRGRARCGDVTPPRRTCRFHTTPIKITASLVADADAVVQQGVWEGGGNSENGQGGGSRPQIGVRLRRQRNGGAPPSPPREAALRLREAGPVPEQDAGDPSVLSLTTACDSALSS